MIRNLFSESDAFLSFRNRTPVTACALLLPTWQSSTSSFHWGTIGTVRELRHPTLHKIKFTSARVEFGRKAGEVRDFANFSPALCEYKFSGIFRTTFWYSRILLPLGVKLQKMTSSRRKFSDATVDPCLSYRWSILPLT